MGEVFALLRKASIDPHLAFDVFIGPLFVGRVHKTCGGKIVDRRYDPPGMTAPLAVKDLRLALAEEEKLAVPMSVASLVLDRLVAAVARDWAGLDWSALGLLAAAAADAGLGWAILRRPASGNAERAPGIALRFRYLGWPATRRRGVAADAALPLPGPLIGMFPLTVVLVVRGSAGTSCERAFPLSLLVAASGLITRRAAGQSRADRNLGCIRAAGGDRRPLCPPLRRRAVHPVPARASDGGARRCRWR
jgi:hypothetical protein